ncbi:MAG: radical SAM protein [Acidobacteriota bacterium]
MSTLIGIARMAAESPLLASKRRVAYFDLQGRSLLNRCSGQRQYFEWTVNPYRGCEYGCQYCYARYTHEFMNLPVEEFDTRIFAKSWDAAMWRRDLRRVQPGETIAFGTATDCYQPAERRYGLMRLLLAGLAAHRGLRIVITTKSDLVARDSDLLRELARRHTVRVIMTVTTMDAGLARRTEPYAPRPDMRMGAVAELASQGLATGVSASPVLPWLTDREESLSAVARAARAAGVATFHARPLFLRDSAWAVFLPWLEREFPALAPRYRSRYARGAHVDRLYGDWLAERVERVRARHGLTARAEEPAPALPLQLPLFS